jgi:PTH1 family peptidyl-tRNA hydrolase
LVVGLANPGAEYAKTRHNAGGDAVELLAQRHGGTLKVESRLRARLSEVRIGDQRVALAIPTTYMNESGDALPGLLDRTGIEDPADLVIVHDELDLEPGRLQLKIGGGIAGHNGLRSIKDVLKTDAFVRLRIGIGRPPGRGPVVNWVLSRPGAADRAAIEVAEVEAGDAVELVSREGARLAMNTVNARG